MDCAAVQSALVEQGAKVHSLHVWSLSDGKRAMTAHLVSDTEEIESKVAAEMREKFGIEFCTVQVETAKYKCVGQTEWP